MTGILFMGMQRDLISGPHAHAACVLLTEPSLQPPGVETFVLFVYCRVAGSIV